MRMESEVGGRVETLPHLPSRCMSTACARSRAVASAGLRVSTRTTGPAADTGAVEYPRCASTATWPLERAPLAKASRIRAKPSATLSCRWRRNSSWAAIFSSIFLALSSLSVSVCVGDSSGGGTGDVSADAGGIASSGEASSTISTTGTTATASTGVGVITSDSASAGMIAVGDGVAAAGVTAAGVGCSTWATGDGTAASTGGGGDLGAPFSDTSGDTLVVVVVSSSGCVWSEPYVPEPWTICSISASVISSADTTELGDNNSTRVSCSVAPRSEPRLEPRSPIAYGSRSLQSPLSAVSNGGGADNAVDGVSCVTSYKPCGGLTGAGADAALSPLRRCSASMASRAIRIGSERSRASTVTSPSLMPAGTPSLKSPIVALMTAWAVCRSCASSRRFCSRRFAAAWAVASSVCVEAYVLPLARFAAKKAENDDARGRRAGAASPSDVAPTEVVLNRSRKLWARFRRSFFWQAGRFSLLRKPNLKMASRSFTSSYHSTRRAGFAARSIWRSCSVLFSMMVG
mmetsp:Transcript_11411/g.34392  ORF Transcript_11411/g.34392 Transcript_11411/m.34392 type:complete len:518 (+) Transcript_11411:175-1728(+)